MIDINGGAVLQADRALAEVVDLPQPSVVGRAVPTPRAWQNSKRLFDFVLAVIALVVLSPLLLLIALAVRLDTPGPVLFRQQRYGRDRKRFVVFKFRSMYDGVSAEAHRRYIAKLATNEDRVGPGLKKLTGDPRVTRIGAFLRRTSLDELPQFINVVRGDMSIIGPRPALDYELEHYEPAHYVRFSVRPGLTGLWQVSGRSELGFLEMLTLDAEYARTTAPGVDAMILLRTPRALLRGKAA